MDGSPSKQDEQRSFNDIDDFDDDDEEEEEEENESLEMPLLLLGEEALETVLVSTNSQSSLGVTALLTSRRSLCITDWERNKQLLQSCRRGDVDLVRELLDSGVDPNYQNVHRESGVFCAADAGSLDCVELLHARGARLDCPTTSGQTPVHMCAAGGHLKLLAWFIAQGCVDVNASAWDGSTAVHVAARMGQDMAIESLVECGAKVNKKDAGGNTALHLAAWRGRTDCIRALLHHEAQVNRTTYYGHTPLHFAVRRFSSSAVQLLVDYGGKLKCKKCQRSKGCRLVPQKNSASAVSLIEENKKQVAEHKRKKKLAQRATKGRANGDQSRSKGSRLSRILRRVAPSSSSSSSSSSHPPPTSESTSNSRTHSPLPRSTETPVATENGGVEVV